MTRKAQLLAKAARQPGYALSVALSILRGRFYKFYYPLRGIRFSAGRNLRVEGRLSIRGPGRVIFGDDVMVAMTVTPWTHSPEAVIRIGDRAFINGTRFGCMREIVVGDDAILAEARVMDTDFHSTWKNRRSADAPIRVLPVRLGHNVWVGADAALLPGTSIGDNSVVALGAVCTGAYPADSIIGGNPARVLKPIPGAAAPAEASPRDARASAAPS